MGQIEKTNYSSCIECDCGKCKRISDWVGSDVMSQQDVRKKAQDHATEDGWKFIPNMGWVSPQCQ